MSSFNTNGSMSFSGMEVFATFAHQTSDMSRAFVRKVVHATEKVGASSSQRRRCRAFTRDQSEMKRLCSRRFIHTQNPQRSQ